MTEPVDIDLHGIVGIRLRGATRSDVDRLTEAIGVAPSRLNRKPDVQIEFVDRLPRNPAAIVVGQAEFSADGTMRLDGPHGAAAIPLAEVGGRCRILCQTGSKSMPLLRSIVNLTALANGGLPLHASSFAVEGRGYLACGWAGGGKTATLLAMMSDGAKFVSDDWTYISPDGRWLLGSQQRLEVKQRYLDELPEYHANIGVRTRTAIRAARFAQTFARCARLAMARHDKLPGRLVRRICDKTLSTKIRPSKLFGTDRWVKSVEADTVFLTCGHRGSDTTIEPLDTVRTVQSLAASLVAESGRLLDCYGQLSFAFPEVRNSLLEELKARVVQQLLRFLQGRDIYLIGHPSPPSIAALRNALRPIVVKDRVASRGRRTFSSTSCLESPSPLALG